MTHLPPELMSKILIMATNRPDLNLKQRRLAFLECLLVCRSFLQCLRSPVTRAEWLVNYHNGAVVSALEFAIENQWDLVAVLLIWKSNSTLSQCDPSTWLDEFLINAVRRHCAPGHDADSADLINGEQIIKYLILAGADPHVMNEFPLRRLCRSGNLNLVRYLVDECKCSIGVKGYECLEFAVFGGHLNIIEFLLARGAPATIGFRKACQRPGDVVTLSWIFKLGRESIMHDIIIDFRNLADVAPHSLPISARIRQNPLVMVAKANLLTPLRTMLDELNVMLSDDEKDSRVLKTKILNYCIYFATVSMKTDAVMMLCAYAERFYALKLACEYGHTELARRLLDEPGNINECETYRENMVDLIRSSVHWEIVELLIHRTGIDWNHVRNSFLLSSNPISRRSSNRKSYNKNKTIINDTHTNIVNYTESTTFNSSI